MSIPRFQSRPMCGTCIVMDLPFARQASGTSMAIPPRSAW